MFNMYECNTCMANNLKELHMIQHASHCLFVVFHDKLNPQWKNIVVDGVRKKSAHVLQEREYFMTVPMTFPLQINEKIFTVLKVQFLCCYNSYSPRIGWKLVSSSVVICCFLFTNKDAFLLLTWRRTLDFLTKLLYLYETVCMQALDTENELTNVSSDINVSLDNSLSTPGYFALFSLNIRMEEVW
jgi:hypothetical protein